MIALPSLFLMSGAVAIGIYLGILYLRRQRPRRLLLGGHILMGMGGLEQVALLIHGAPSGVMVQAGTYGTAAAGFFALAMLSGFTAPLFGQRSRKNGEFMLATHAVVGLVGFILLLVWLSNLQSVGLQ
jgi:hypothetical protein